jgi:uncharacterized protein YdhG (YjbR/CyaY superfamily)
MATYYLSLQFIFESFHNRGIKNELKDFTMSKGTIRFATDRPLSTTLVKIMVKARVEENESKKRH